MMTRDDVLAGLREIFADVFMRDDIALSPELTAGDVEGWDSFKQVEIIMSCEQHFKLKFTSSEVDGFRRLGDLMAVVERRGA